MVVELTSDRKGGSKRVVKGVEKSGWNRFYRKFCLLDSYCYHSGHHRYSWDNKKRGRHDPIV